MTLDVSVVIPQYNEDLSVRDCAAYSAEAAGSNDIILVEDGSRMEYGLIPPFGHNAFVYTDHGRYQNIISIHAGVCHARNLGVFYAKNNLIVPLDADDELLPESLQILVKAWEPGTLVYGNWIETGPTGPGGEGFDTLKFAAPPEMLSRKNVAHATWLFHKDDWARVGGYDPDFNIGGEDWAFMCALVEAGVKPVHIKAPIFRRTVRSGSRTDLARNRIDFIKQLLREKYPRVMHTGR